MAVAAGNNISLPEPLLVKLQSVAQAEHRSVGEVPSDAVKRYLDDRSWTDLLDYGAERANALGIKESDIDRLISKSRSERHRPLIAATPLYPRCTINSRGTGTCYMKPPRLCGTCAFILAHPVKRLLHDPTSEQVRSSSIL